MSTQFILNGLNIGEDVSLTLTANPGGSFPAESLGHLKKVDVNFKFKHIEVPGITFNGQTMQESAPRGVTCKLNFARMQGNLTKELIRYRTAWFQGIRTNYSLSVRVKNRDNTVDQYLLIGGKPTDGNKDAEPGKEIDQGITLEFSDIQLNGTSIVAT